MKPWHKDVFQLMKTKPFDIDDVEDGLDEPHDEGGKSYVMMRYDEDEPWTPPGRWKY